MMTAEDLGAAKCCLRDAVRLLAIASAYFEGEPEGEVADRLMDEAAALLVEVTKNGAT